MINIFCLFFTVAVFWCDLAKGNVRCTFEISNVDLRKMPLAYQIDRNKKLKLVYPEGDRKFTVDRNQKIVFSCLTRFFTLPVIKNKHEIEVTCLNGTKFVYNGQTYEYIQFMCNDFLRSSCISTNRICKHPNGNTVINVGYQTQKYFFTVYSVCFDSTNKNTLYSWYPVRVPYYDIYQHQTRIGFFKDTTIFGTVNIDTFYNKSKQIQSINTILNLNQRISLYMDQNNYYLTKGHLTSMTDFYLAHEQAATFNFLNVFPHWIHSNRLWERIEQVVRNQNANNRNSKRVVVSGVHGEFQMPDNRNSQRVLYIRPTLKQFLVPKFQWKMIYDRYNPHNSIVYIGLNNRLDKPLPDITGYINCTRKACPEVNGIDSSLHLYCCDIESFEMGYGRLDRTVFNTEPTVYTVPAA